MKIISTDFKALKRLHSGKRAAIAVLFLITMLASIFAGNALGVDKGMGGKNPIVAHVDSKPITLQDIEDKQINDLRVELHKRVYGRLQLMALARLSETHPEYNLGYRPSISDAEILGFFNKNDLKSRGSYESLKPRIKSLMEMRAMSAYYDRLYQKAVKQGLIVAYLQEPSEFLVKVPVDTAYLWGTKQERVMVLEFSDYQCPFCSRVQGTIKQLRKTYRNRVLFGYRHSPLAFHQEADEAAIAAECARDQGKFKQYHEILFDNYRNISIQGLDQFAEKAGVPDRKQFKTCLAGEKYRGRVENDQKAASEAGIRGTPGFIIRKYNPRTGIVAGEVLSGAQPQDAFTAIIDKFLGKQ